MDKQKLQELKGRLEEEKRSTLRTLNLVEENEFNDSLQKYTDEISLYDNHPADVGTETFEMEKTYALKGNELHRLEEIEQALERIEKGTYGVCTICGKDIDIERLEAYPEADTCMECSRSRKLPWERVRIGRPVEEEVVSYPYNRETSIEDDQIEFDGEDSWQAVARYNRREGDPSDQTADHQGMWDGAPSGSVQRVERTGNKYYEKQLPEDDE
jgi:YteA family regulatory protein